MSTHEQATTDSTHPSQPASQRKTGSSIGDKASGLVNIIHGTGEVIRGHAMEAGDLGHGHGNGKVIAAAGREEVERGLNKIEGTHVRTSAATDAPNGGGPHNGTGAAHVGDPNAPHTSAAAPRTDPSDGKARVGDAPVTSGYTGPTDRKTGTGIGTASAAGGAVGGGPGTDLRTDEQIAAPAPPARGDRLASADDPNVQHHGVGSVTAPGDSHTQTHPSTNLPLSGETGGPRSDQRTDEQFATHAPLGPGGRPAAARPADDPNVQHDTGVESRLAPGDTGNQARPTTNLPPGETAAQLEQSSGTAAQMEQRSDRPADGKRVENVGL